MTQGIPFDVYQKLIKAHFLLRSYYVVTEHKFSRAVVVSQKNPPVEQNGLMMKHKLDLIFRDKNMQILKLTTNSSPNISTVLCVLQFLVSDPHTEPHKDAKYTINDFLD